MDKASQMVDNLTICKVHTDRPHRPLAFTTKLNRNIGLLS